MRYGTSVDIGECSELSAMVLMELFEKTVRQSFFRRKEMRWAVLDVIEHKLHGKYNELVNILDI